MAQGDVTANISRPTGKALHFDGINDLINMGTDASLNIKNNYTIALRVKGHVDWDVMAADEPIFDSGDHGGSPGKGYHTLLKIDADSTNKLQFITLDDDGITTRSILSTKASWNKNQWYHIVIVCDLNNIISWYIDGTLDNTEAFYELNTGNYGGFWFGKRSTGSVGSIYFDGTIDDIRIYNKALSAEEALKLYKKQPLSNKGLISKWSFNNSADPGHDDSGNGNNGTITGATTVGGQDTTEDDIKNARVTAGDRWGFIPLADDRQIMTVHIEEV